jgi:hypothetical protein
MTVFPEGGMGIWAILALQGVVFLVWTIEAFRILFHLLGRARAETGHLSHGPFMFLRMARAWLADPHFRAQRWRFLGLTLALMALALVVAVAQPFAP